MIDIRKLKELVRLMVSNDLTEVDLRDSQEQVTLKRTSPAAVPHVVHAPMSAVAHPVHMPPAAAPASGSDDDGGLVAIESPMVGTFYTASGPEKPAFVTVGSKVGPDTVICLIEAMKVFNEIKAERAGTIERVLVKNGEPVEFGQRLFLLRA
jgi:acetyl-CoA carboxylase biotin carboxyl carrier protein